MIGKYALDIYYAVQVSVSFPSEAVLQQLNEVPPMLQSRHPLQWPHRIALPPGWRNDPKAMPAGQPVSLRLLLERYLA